MLQAAGPPRDFKRPPRKFAGNLSGWYSDGMDEKPKRRWFRFRLSTVLILTAIVAWAMACWPWRIAIYTYYTPIRSEETSWFVNRDLRWPALALAAFLAWKAVLAIVARRHARAARDEQASGC